MSAHRSGMPESLQRHIPPAFDNSALCERPEIRWAATDGSPKPQLGDSTPCLVPSRAGRVFAVMLVVLGVLAFVSTGSVIGLWSALVRLFVYSAARGEEGYALVQSTMANLTVRPVMTPALPSVPGQTTVADMVSLLWLYRGDVAAVTDDSGLAGVVSDQAVDAVPLERRTNRERNRDSPYGDPTEARILSLPQGPALASSDGRSNAARDPSTRDAELMLQVTSVRLGSRLSPGAKVPLRRQRRPRRVNPRRAVNRRIQSGIRGPTRDNGTFDSAQIRSRDIFSNS